MNKTLLFTLAFISLISNFSTATNLEDYDHSPTKRVRIDFTAPNGYTRHLLLAFTPHDEATDGIDYGYDTLNMDALPYDLSWIIENGRYIIQGVGEYKEEMVFPLELFMSEEGNIAISLAGIENFNSEIPVYLFDSFTQEFTVLNEVDYESMIGRGEYVNRYFIAFSNSNNSLSLEDELSINTPKIYYNTSSKKLVIDVKQQTEEVEIALYELDGKEIFHGIYTNTSIVELNSTWLSTSIKIIQIRVGNSTLSRAIVISS